MLAKRITLVTWLVLVTVAFAPARPPGGSQVRNPAEHFRYPDEDLIAMVQHALKSLGIEDLDVACVAGNVTLKGRTATLGDKREAARRSYLVHGVTDVTNEIEVMSRANDDDIVENVNREIETYVHYTIFDNVEAGSQDGTVVLTGRVTAPHKIAEIEHHVAKVGGVREIVNQVEALPYNPSDEQLRIALAIAMYRRLPDYASTPDRRIHIVVEDGRVTLAGIVHDEADVLIAGVEARRTPGVLSVDNRLRAAGTP